MKRTFSYLSFVTYSLFYQRVRRDLLVATQWAHKWLRWDPKWGFEVRWVLHITRWEWDSQGCLRHPHHNITRVFQVSVSYI